MANNKMTPHLIDANIRFMDRLPNATLAEVIGNLFQPIGKITPTAIAAFKEQYKRGKTVTSQDGFVSLTVKKPLTQEHKNLIDVLISNLTPYYVAGSRAPYFFYTPNWLTKKMGFPKDTRRLKQLIEYLSELTLTCRSPVRPDLMHEDNKGLIASFGRFVAGKTAIELEADANICDGLHYIQINENYIQASELDKNVRYAPLVEGIVALPDARLQAAVRLALSFGELNMVLEDTKAADGSVKPGFITRMGISGRSNYYEVRKMLMSEATQELLAPFGLKVGPNNSGRMTMYKVSTPEGVLINNPPLLKELRKAAKLAKSGDAGDNKGQEAAPAAKGPGIKLQARTVEAAATEMIAPLATLVNRLYDGDLPPKVRIDALLEFVDDACRAQYQQVLDDTGVPTEAMAAYQDELMRITTHPEVAAFMEMWDFSIQATEPADAGEPDTHEIEEDI